jgi:hypothetical protein
VQVIKNKFASRRKDAADGPTKAAPPSLRQLASALGVEYGRDVDDEGVVDLMLEAERKPGGLLAKAFVQSAGTYKCRVCKIGRGDPISADSLTKHIVSAAHLNAIADKVAKQRLLAEALAQSHYNLFKKAVREWMKECSTVFRFMDATFWRHTFEIAYKTSLPKGRQAYSVVPDILKDVEEETKTRLADAKRFAERPFTLIIDSKSFHFCSRLVVLVQWTVDLSTTRMVLGVASRASAAEDMINAMLARSGISWDDVMGLSCDAVAANIRVGERVTAMWPHVAVFPCASHLVNHVGEVYSSRLCDFLVAFNRVLSSRDSKEFLRLVHEERAKRTLPGLLAAAAPAAVAAPARGTVAPATDVDAPHLATASMTRWFGFVDVLRTISAYHGVIEEVSNSVRVEEPTARAVQAATAAGRYPPRRRYFSGPCPISSELFTFVKDPRLKDNLQEVEQSIAVASMLARVCYYADAEGVTLVLFRLLASAEVGLETALAVTDADRGEARRDITQALKYLQCRTQFNLDDPSKAILAYNSMFDTLFAARVLDPKYLGDLASPISDDEISTAALQLVCFCDGPSTAAYSATLKVGEELRSLREEVERAKVLAREGRACILDLFADADVVLQAAATIKFWRDRKETFPCLHYVANRLINVPASVTSVDRFFSEVGARTSSRQSRESDETFECRVRLVFGQRTLAYNDRGPRSLAEPLPRVERDATQHADVADLEPFDGQRDILRELGLTDD